MPIPDTITLLVATAPATLPIDFSWSYSTHNQRLTGAEVCKQDKGDNSGRKIQRQGRSDRAGQGASLYVDETARVDRPAGPHVLAFTAKASFSRSSD